MVSESVTNFQEADESYSYFSSIGGEYPLSASVTSENSSKLGREKNLALVFSMQGFGTLLCAIVLIIVTNCIDNYDTQWRMALAFGALPMTIAFYFRWSMQETTLWNKSHEVIIIMCIHLN